MSAKAFLDTSVLIYGIHKDDPRADVAEALLAGGCLINVQVLNEFVSVAVRKLRMPREEITRALDFIRRMCPNPEPVTIEKALGIARRHGYGIFDALLIAAALIASCTTLYSEDLRDGQTIEGLTIRNPFRKM